MTNAEGGETRTGLELEDDGVLNNTYIKNIATTFRNSRGVKDFASGSLAELN